MKIALAVRMAASDREGGAVALEVTIAYVVLSGFWFAKLDDDAPSVPTPAHAR